MNGHGAKSNSLWVHWNLFWKLSSDGNLQSLGMSYAMTASPKPLGHLRGCLTPWSAEETMDGQHQTADIPAHARTAKKGLLKNRLVEDRL